MKKRLETAMTKIMEAKQEVDEARASLEPENRELKSCSYHLGEELERLEGLMQLVEAADREAIPA